MKALVASVRWSGRQSGAQAGNDRCQAQLLAVRRSWQALGTCRDQSAGRRNTGSINQLVRALANFARWPAALGSARYDGRYDPHQVRRRVDQTRLPAAWMA